MIGNLLNDLRNKLVAWHPTWLHDNEVMSGVNKDHILLIGFRGIEGYSPVRVVNNLDGSNNPFYHRFFSSYIKDDSTNQRRPCNLEKTGKG